MLTELKLRPRVAPRPKLESLRVVLTGFKLRLIENTQGRSAAVNASRGSCYGRVYTFDPSQGQVGPMEKESFGPLEPEP